MAENKRLLAVLAALLLFCISMTACNGKTSPPIEGTFVSEEGAEYVFTDGYLTVYGIMDGDMQTFVKYSYRILAGEGAETIVFTRMEYGYAGEDETIASYMDEMDSSLDRASPTELRMELSLVRTEGEILLGDQKLTLKR